MVPNYVAKKSVWDIFRNKWWFLWSLLVIPLIIKIICVKSWSIEFYDNRYVVKSGVFNKIEIKQIFSGVLSVTTFQPFWGRVFNYGYLFDVDCPGAKWDLRPSDANLSGDKKERKLQRRLGFNIETRFKNIKGLKRYLESRIDTRGVTNVIHN